MDEQLANADGDLVIDAWAAIYTRENPHKILHYPCGVFTALQFNIILVKVTLRVHYEKYYTRAWSIEAI